MSLKDHFLGMTDEAFLAAVLVMQDEMFRRWPAVAQAKEAVKKAVEESPESQVATAFGAAVEEVKIEHGGAVQ